MRYNRRTAADVARAGKQQGAWAWAVSSRVPAALSARLFPIPSPVQ
jgi:hypothetical protein